MTTGAKSSKAQSRTKHCDPFPKSVKPMLATLVDQPFDRPDWLFEIKWDGFRAIGEVENGAVRLYSRNMLSFADRFGPVVSALEDLGHDAVLDGEIVALDREGKSQFQLLQNYQRTGAGHLAYCVFDVLYLDGRDMRGLPLRERKKKLARLIKDGAVLRLSDHVEEDGIAFFKALTERGLEGMIAKNAASLYREGERSLDWLKIKARRQQEVVIGGYTDPRGSRQKFGSLILGIYEGKDFVYVGHAGGGFNAKSLEFVYAKLKPLEQIVCPFKRRPKTNAPAHWVKPKLVCEVVFQEWTSEGLMRMPVFLGLREDKAATKVRREVPRQISINN